MKHRTLCLEPDKGSKYYLHYTADVGIPWGPQAASSLMIPNRVAQIDSYALPSYGTLV